MEEIIKIVQGDNGVFNVKFESGVYEEEGNGATIKEAVEDMFFNIELNEKESQEEKQKFFIETNMPKAKEMAVELFNVMGPDYFEMRHIINKTGMNKQGALLKLNFLSNFGLCQPDRKKGAGQRWKIEVDSDSLQQYYFNEAEKWEATAKYYRGLGEELKNVDKQIAEEKANQAAEESTEEEKVEE